MQHLLMPVLKDPRVSVTIEYSEEEAKALMTVRANGPQLTMSELQDDISVAVLKGIVSHPHYERLNSGE